ncbi:alpha-D-ribose 1-methylphosphonate 5-triphosphate diphosphatase [Jannaschia sp. 2305UL9-9]|uniref:alpha-D-ribose 1-methylphosphonate 5-triphosphate diphosphatase n=1 Tax=Jannaschia sp. 2305UL9-9 TaxID=3121638 RepID=UPI003528E9D0
MASMDDDHVTSGCLANATLVLDDRTMRGAIAWSHGIITAITEGTDVPDGATDCRGDVVLPGLVELHTDSLERHIEPRPGVDWPHDAALMAHDRELASCGITTVFDAMRVGSVLSGGKMAYVEYARGLATEMLALRAAGGLQIEHFLHLRAEICSETLLEELAAFGPQDGVGILSLMDHTPGQRQFRDISKLRAYVMGKRGMDEAGFQAHVANLQRLRDAHGDAHEAGAVAAARRIGAVLASHDDTTADQVAVSARHGVRVAEFPTTFEAAEACRDAGIPVMMGAPNVIRGGSHSGNVSALDLAGAGLLNVLSSDYVPSGLLLAAWRLSAVWNDLPRAVATVTRTPAQAAGLQDRGALQPGLRADVLRVRDRDGTPSIQRVICGGRTVA